MEKVIIKEEPIDYENVPIKIEPQDESDSNYGCIIFKDDFDFKLEIKQEPHEQDDYMSPSPTTSNPLSPESTCRVVILEQPLKKVRFRYLSELQGTPHGPLLGEGSTKTSKTFPKVQLVGYEGREPVKMRCWLVDKTQIKGEVRPHCHDLVVRKCIPRNDIVCEPHEVCISRENNYTAVFENMVVLHCVQKDSECKYFEKEVKWNSRDTVSPAVNSRLDKKKIRDKIRSINKNEVYLFFEAYIEYRNSVVILCSALSNSIKNLKNPVSGDLKICRAMNNVGPCEGDTEVGLFTEKVPPDVKVKFFCHDRSPTWETIVSPEFMHRHVALTFRTPKLPFNIDDNLKVKYCLYRESDGVVSNSMDFTYQPSDLMLHGIGLKRRRIESSLDNSDSNGSDEATNIDLTFKDLFSNVKSNKLLLNPVKPTFTPLTAIRLNSFKQRQILKQSLKDPVVVKEEPEDSSDDIAGPNKPLKLTPSLASLSPDQVKTIKTLKPGFNKTVPSNKVPQPAKKVFHVSKVKFQTYLKMMRSKGYIVKSIT